MNAKNFSDYSLMELASVIVDNRGKSCPTADFGIPLIATNCIKSDHLYPVFENVRYVDDETYGSWFRGHPEPNDILFVCKGSPGLVAIVPDPVPFCIAQDMVAIRANHDVVSPRYLYYLLKLPATLQAIENMHVGTMIPHFKKGDFKNLNLRVHASLDEQCGIADVLGALDDKITANRMLADTADCLAVTTLKGVPSVLLDELVDHRRTSMQPSESDGEFVAQFSLPAFDEKEMPELVDPTSIKSAKFRIDSPSVLISKLNPRFPRVWDVPVVPEVPAFASTEFLVLEPKFGSTATLWAALRQPAVAQQLESMVAGTSSSHQRVKPKDVLGVQVADLRKLDGDVIRSIESLTSVIHSARQESTELVALRDLLLPRLMSGELRVRDAEKFVEEAL